MPMLTAFLLEQSVHQQYRAYNIIDFVAKLLYLNFIEGCIRHGGHVPPTNETLWKAVRAIAELLKQHSSNQAILVSPMTPTLHQHRSYRMPA